MKQAADTSRQREPTAPIASGFMRALRFDGAAPALVTNHPQPQPQPGEALVRTTKAAVSAIDIELSRGLLEFSGTLGHEFVGVVEVINGEIGPISSAHASSARWRPCVVVVTCVRRA